MPNAKPDLSTVKGFMNWALYGLAAVAGWAYIDMRSQRNECQKENNYYARTSFDNAMKDKKIQEQEKLIEEQDTAIVEAVSYIRDSIKPVNIKKIEDKLKIKQK